jgi:hypothetical protein
MLKMIGIVAVTASTASCGGAGYGHSRYFGTCPTSVHPPISDIQPRCGC